MLLMPQTYVGQIGSELAAAERAERTCSRPQETLNISFFFFTQQGSDIQCSFISEKLPLDLFSLLLNQLWLNMFCMSHVYLIVYL